MILIERRSNPAAREMLFAGARPLDQAAPGMPPAGPTSDWESGRGDNYGGNFESYDQRQLTEEEQQEEDITGAKQEIRFLKQSDVSSTRNALRLAAQAEETARSTLERIGAQGESIHNTERNLDLASNQNRLAAEYVAHGVAG
jgi:protein transport protein SEC9